MIKWIALILVMVLLISNINATRMVKKQRNEIKQQQQCIDTLNVSNMVYHLNMKLYERAYDMLRKRSGYTNIISVELTNIL